MGAVVAIGGMQLALIQEKFWLFNLFYVLAFGISTGLVYSSIFYHAWLFFPGKEGFISGVIIAGFGIGGSLFITIST